MILTQNSELTRTDLKVLELYADGLPYRSIQRELRKHTGENFDKRRLGEKMGDLKKKMDCATQFQMGFRYAHRSYSDLIDTIRENCENQIETAKLESFKKGEDLGYTKGRILTETKQNNKGLIAGLVFATIFWVVVFYTIFYLNYFQMIEAI